LEQPPNAIKRDASCCPFFDEQELFEMLRGIFRCPCFALGAIYETKLDVITHRPLAQIREGTELIEGKRLTRRVAGRKRGLCDSVHVFILTL
jgi:hypothetical protein